MRIDRSLAMRAMTVMRVGLRAWLVAAGMLLAVGCGDAIDPASPPFRQLDLDAAMAEAGRDGKAVFIDFYATWCPPCRRLEAVTWPDASVQEWLLANTIPLKIDAEREHALASRFGVQAYPTLLFLDADGRELGRVLGFRDPGDFVTEGARILAAAAPNR
jgi:thiol:disulfide interchange protein